MFVAQSLKMISQVGTKQLMALWQPSCSLLAAIASRSRNWNGGCKSSVQSRRAEEHGWAEMHQRRTIGPALCSHYGPHSRADCVTVTLVRQIFQVQQHLCNSCIPFCPFTIAFFPATKLVQLRARALSKCHHDHHHSFNIARNQK